MCPGGGYALLAYDHEGYAYADYFKHQGIALIVLKYRMPHGNHKVPMSDVCEAMRVVKSHAAEWKINPDDIGIMGFPPADTWLLLSRPTIRQNYGQLSKFSFIR